MPLVALAGEVTGFDVDAGEDYARVSIVLEGEAEPKVFGLDGPPRLVIDLAGAKLGVGGAKRDGDGRVVRSVRYSQFVLEPEPVTRVVLDLVRAADYEIQRTPAGFVLEFGRVPARSVAVTPAAPLRQAKPAPASTPEVSTPPAESTSGTATPADASSTPATATVQTVVEPDGPAITYMTLSTVYVSAGRSEGVGVGDRLCVQRDAKVLGTLRVDNVSSHRSACSIVEKSEELALGDAVGRFGEGDGEEPVFLAIRTEVPSMAGGKKSRGSDERNWLRANGFKGRIGGRFLTVQDRSGTGQSFSQPALDARIEGRDVGGSDFDLSVDVRTRRTYRQEADGGQSQEGRSRVYRANAAWKALDSRLSLTVGRQSSPELSSLSIFDGASLAFRGARVSVGLLSGSQPDLIDFGYSTEIREHGGFFQLRSAQGSEARWSTTLGLIGSYADGEINREYLALQTHWANGRFSLYASQDLDLNREWRLETEGKSVSLNNTYASVRMKVAKETTLSGGFDNRRSIRLYRDYVSPEIEFDDTFRQGVWAGVSQRVGRSYRFGLRAKRSTGGSAGNADTYTANVAIQWPVTLRARTSHFSNELVQGWIHSGSAGVQLGGRMRFEVGGGVREQKSETAVGGDDRLVWTNAMVDYSLGRSWYASISVERSDQGADANDQIFSMLNYRF